ncbi:MAG: hypothetical protein EA397_15950 [Deltaproteobacteria bacterium]|nr:MAG: hypothetical protein EA397_15950 [Deltaproteobacteria bacterium]
MTSLSPRLCLLLLSVLGGCTDPVLVIGTGERAFERLDPDDPVLELVYGPQGGWHVVLAFEARGLASGGLSIVDGTGVIDNQLVATIDSAWVTFTSIDGRQQSWNTFMIFDVPDPGPLHRAWLEIDVQVTDPRGRIAEGQAEAMILDTQRGD